MLSTATAIVGVIGLSASTQGYLFTDASIPERVLLFAGALSLLIPGMMTDGIGIVLLGVVAARQYAAVSEDMALASAIGR